MKFLNTFWRSYDTGDFSKATLINLNRLKLIKYYSLPSEFG